MSHLYVSPTKLRRRAELRRQANALIRRSSQRLHTAAAPRVRHDGVMVAAFRRALTRIGIIDAPQDRRAMADLIVAITNKRGQG